MRKNSGRQDRPMENDMKDERTEGSRDQITERPSDGPDTPESNFKFFSEFTKPLVLELPSADDRAVAAAWVQKLEAEPEADEDKNLRVDYLKLLLFVMQRGRLIGIFKKEPAPGPLQPFPQGFGLAEMGSALLEQAELQGSGDAKESEVSYSVEVSNDLKEYVAAQEIPNFGVQVYYAWSNEDPIHRWKLYDEKKFPPHVREKVNHIKKMASADKTQVQNQRDKPDYYVRKACEVGGSDNSKVKVKSPQEIEKERSSQYECDFKASPRMNSSRRTSPQGSNIKMDFASTPVNKICCRGQESGSTTPDGEEEDMMERHLPDDDDCPQGGMKNDASGRCKQGCCGRSPRSPRSKVKSSGCIPSSQSSTGRGLLRGMQKCDDGGEGRYTNERVCSGGRGLKNADHRGADTYAYSGVCAADPAEKYQVKGYEMNSSSSRRKKCHSPGSTLCHQTAHPGSCCQSHRRSHKKSNQSTQDDSEKKSTYRTPTKSATCSPSNPCHSCKSMKEQLRESSSCPQKRVSEKGTSDRCVQKGKQTQQQQQQSKLQQNPCPALEEIMKIKRKNAEEMGRMDYVVGCTCGSNDRQKQIENLSRITQKKSPNVPYQQQQQAPFSGRKTVGPDKRQQATGYQCSVPSQGGVPGSGAIPKKRTMQPTNAGLSQCHTECRVKGETCCVKTTKPKQEYETKMASPPVKGLHVVGMTPPPQPAPQQQQQKAACPQLPPPSIFTHLAESFYDQQFVDDLSSGSDENGGEEDAQNAVCNPIALPYMKNEGAENFQCEDAQTDEGADCYSSSSENVTNKGVNGACVYDNAEGGAYAKTPQAMKSNVGEPPSRRKMQVCAPPNSPANMSRYPENYPKAQMFGMEQRIHPSYQCPGCQSPDDHLNMKSMTSTPCAGKAVAPDEFFSDVSEIIDETPQYNQYQDEDEVLVQGQPYSTGRGAVSMKSFAMTGRHKYEDQGNNQMDESQSFVSLQDFDQSDMSQTPRAFQKQKMGRSFGMDSNYARALWIQAFGPQDGQDPDATTDGRGRRRTDGGVPQGYCPRDTRDPRESFRSSRYGDFSDTLRDYDSRNITRMTDSPRYGQCNRSQRSMQNHSYLRDQSTWAESSRGQDNENSNSRWTDWPEYRKKFHDDRCQLMQNTRM